MIKKLLLVVYYLFIAKLPNSAYLEMSNKIRVFYLSKVLIIMKYDKESIFENDIYISDIKNLSIGRHCHINQNVFIQGATIGNYVMIAPNVAILNSTHNYDRTDIPMILQGERKKLNPIIEDDVWIGRNAIIMPGIRIQKGSIVGAGAVVVKDVPSYSVVGGVPARILRMRK
jgi:maltose O-acetyltransferase